MSMHPLISSPTQTNLKSKWHNLKNWFTPDFNKRRPSQCSIATTASSNSCCCQTKEDVYQKRPSLTGSENLFIVVDKCMSPFRRRPSNASFNLDQEIPKLMDSFNLALTELNYAEDSQGSLYYSGDRVAAEAAINSCNETYNFLLKQSNLQQQQELTLNFGVKINQLFCKLGSLPKQDDRFTL